MTVKKTRDYFFAFLWCFFFLRLDLERQGVQAAMPPKAPRGLVGGP